MQNAAVAQMFDEIADLLEIAGENPFQSRAYRRAAEAVASYPSPIEDASAAELRAIPGLGPATSDKTKEFLATGRVAVLEKLRSEYPRSLLEMRKVPGLGPKKIALLYRERGISSIDQLQLAIDKGELAGLAGLGPKTVANIQEGIRRLQSLDTRLPLIDALPLARSIAQVIAGFKNVETVEIAGEARRGCETVSSLAWVAAAQAAEPVLKSFVSLPQVSEILEQSPASARVRMRPGIDATLWVGSPDIHGGVLFFATGSEAHVHEAKRRATSQSKNLTRFTTEVGLYGALGNPFIDPELRENGDEWDIRQRLELVTLADIKGDLHAHSTWSDGVNTIRQMVEAALARGYQYHAVTDHSKALAMANGLDARRLREQAIEISEVQAEFPQIKILRGVECDILKDGSLDLDDEILSELDWVIASVHSAFNLTEAMQTARVIRAISHPAVNIVAHPTGRILGARPGYDLDFKAVVQAARDHGTALEINASHRLDMRDEHAHMARENGVMIAINTDAHSIAALPDVEIGVATARRAWCEPQHILNTKPIDDLLKWLARNK